MIAIGRRAARAIGIIVIVELSSCCEKRGYHAIGRVSRLPCRGLVLSLQGRPVGLFSRWCNARLARGGLINSYSDPHWLAVYK